MVSVCLLVFISDFWLSDGNCVGETMFSWSGISISSVDVFSSCLGDFLGILQSINKLASAIVDFLFDESILVFRLP